jgi:hypothetical protein
MLNVIKVLLMVAVCVTILAFALKKDYTVFNAKTLFWIKVGGGAFVQDHIYRGTKYQYNFGISSNIHKDDSIAFCTKTNYNGTAIPSGNNTDDTGFTIGKFDGYRKMVFYKEMLYPRTVNMLTINMIKNMMAEDGIIDIQGKLFTDKFTGDFNLDFNK